jgi:hypothetical protein
VMIASGLIVWFVFVPPYFHFAPLIYGERVGFFMYLVAATLTIAFARSCRVVLRRLQKGAWQTKYSQESCSIEIGTSSPSSK